MTSAKNYNSCVSNRIQAILSGFLPSIHAVSFKGCLSSLIPPFLSPHSLSFIIYAWKCQILGTLNDGRHFIVVVTVAWPNLHSCMPILTKSLPLSLFLSVFLYQSNFQDRKHHHDNLPTPCETLWSHRRCAAHGNLFPMIHIYQMTLKCCEFGLLIRLPFFHLWTQSATLNLTHTYCQWFCFFVFLFFILGKSMGSNRISSNKQINIYKGLEWQSTWQHFPFWVIALRDKSFILSANRQWKKVLDLNIRSNYILYYLSYFLDRKSVV